MLIHFSFLILRTFILVVLFITLSILLLLFFSFWINHDLIKVRPLVPVIQQLKEYLEKAKDEIVIIDFHRFPLGFSGRIARHVQLVDYLELELKEYAISYSNETLTLNDIWDTNKRLIISYGDKSIARGNGISYNISRKHYGFVVNRG